jgi:hypothetical protein
MEGWRPDVTIVDYMDILAPEPDAPKEHRHQLDHTWKVARRFSQERKCLLLSATQSDAASYGKSITTMMNFSENKRQLGHVSGMIGINHTDEEKMEGGLNAGLVVAREKDFVMTKQCKILRSIPTGRPFLGSYLKYF